MSHRLNIISAHISSKFPSLQNDNSLESFRSKSNALNKSLIQQEYFQFNLDYLDSIRGYINKDPLFNHFEELGLSVPETRTRVLNQVKSVINAFPSTLKDDKSDPMKKFAVLYALAEYDLQVCTRLIVTYILYLDTLINLGTEKHRDLIERAYRFEDFGCIAMTELAQGSNVTNLETTAIYDKNLQEFVINSPSPQSAKWWIGGAAETANMCILFAQLFVANINKGVHVFVVPIRDSSNNVIKGVTIGDCGRKVSLNGVDNGFIMFNNYRVPYAALLNRHSDVTLEGQFRSSIKNKEKRLATMLGGLIRGRLAVVSGAEMHLKNALTIAIRYSALRKQFSPSPGPEASILSYQMQKFRLMPLLAQTFAIRAGVNFVGKLYEKGRERFLAEPECQELAEFNAILSGLKAVCSWYSVQGIQVCREACGGLGYSAFSGLGRIRGNQDAHVIWEGDNTILLQQTSKYILKQIQKPLKAQKSVSITLGFLKVIPGEITKASFTLPEAIEKSDIFKALERKVRYLLENSLVKLQERAASADTVTEAWSNAQVFYLTELAKSYSEYLMCKSLYEMAEKLESQCKPTGEALCKLAKIYGLWVFEKGIGFNYELGYQAGTGKIVRDALVQCCEDVGEICLGIIDAIAPSDKCLGSTIGANDGQAYARMIQAVEGHLNVYKHPEWIGILRGFHSK